MNCFWIKIVAFLIAQICLFILRVEGFSDWRAVDPSLYYPVLWNSQPVQIQPTQTSRDTVLSVYKSRDTVLSVYFESSDNKRSGGVRLKFSDSQPQYWVRYCMDGYTPFLTNISSETDIKSWTLQRVDRNTVRIFCDGYLLLEYILSPQSCTGYRYWRMYWHRATDSVNFVPSIGSEFQWRRLDNTSVLLVNGGWSKYSAWSKCSQDCEEGFQSRERNCSNPEPSNGGRPCTGNTTEVQTCNLKQCPIDFIWKVVSIFILASIIFAMLSCFLTKKKCESTEMSEMQGNSLPLSSSVLSPVSYHHNKA